jgi:hypothetical protein
MTVKFGDVATTTGTSGAEGEAQAGPRLHHTPLLEPVPTSDTATVVSAAVARISRDDGPAGVLAITVSTMARRFGVDTPESRAAA